MNESRTLMHYADYELHFHISFCILMLCI